MKPDDTSMDQFYFDINGSRYIPYNPKINNTDSEKHKDDLPAYMLRSNKPLFLCVFDDTTSSPCLEILEETVEQIEGVEMMSVFEKVVVWEHAL